MSDKLTIEQTGFETWLELWIWVKEQGLQDQPKVTLTWENVELEEGEEPPADVTIPVILIKWKAFDEIEASLPSKGAVEVIRELIWAEEKKQKDMDMINEFLTKLPAKP